MSNKLSPILEKLLQQARERKQAELAAKAEAGLSEISYASPIASAISSLYTDQERGITYNERQSQFISLMREGKSACLIGAAGTGKTTSMKGALNALIQSGHVPEYIPDGHKHLDGKAIHGILICAFTRRAVANIRKNLSKDMQGSCITVHAALEYAPEFFEVIDPITLEAKNSMRFTPTRGPHRMLSESIKFCVIEESSMLGTELFAQLKDALSPDCRFILLGDIQQLPPVFGPAILGYKMLEYPVVELNEVYRQALESPIISLAHRILSGNPMPLTELEEWNQKYSEKGLSFHPIKKKLTSKELKETKNEIFRSPSRHPCTMQKKH